MTYFEQVVFGLLLADFLSGVLHWIEDQYGNPKLPIIGGVFAANELHHKDPLAFTKGSFAVRNASTVVLTALIGGVLLVVFGPSVWLISAILFGSMANEFHVWAHTRPKNTLISMFQEMGILTPPHQHARHHRHPHHRAYCVITGFLNPVLDRIGFWRKLERLVPLRAKSGD